MQLHFEDTTLIGHVLTEHLSIHLLVCLMTKVEI